MTWKQKMMGNELINFSIDGDITITSTPLSEESLLSEYISSSYSTVFLTREQIRNLYQEMVEIDGSGDEIVPVCFKVLVDRNMIR